MKSTAKLLKSWGIAVEGPLIIAGPCSAESLEQVMTTARQLATDGKVQVFRAGVWKPRTRPGAFEGHGQIALSWLATVKRETGLLTTCEVASPKHVELALNAGVDILWIGARTSVNPFLVQEIAESLRGQEDTIIMIKNPVCPDLDLWIGAMERFDSVGIKKVAAIHRGFSTPDKSHGFRNAPLWDIPLAFRQCLPQIPLVCDPSHITGNSLRIGEVSTIAMDLDFDGLMIETHPRPATALTDARQQITMHHLNQILEQLEERSRPHCWNVSGNVVASLKPC